MPALGPLQDLQSLVRAVEERCARCGKTAELGRVGRNPPDAMLLPPADRLPRRLTHPEDRKVIFLV
jgi:hypothetical protein